MIFLPINEEEKEPLKTLAAYRRRGDDIHFARNVVHSGIGIINVGDEIRLLNNHININASLIKSDE